MTTSLTQEQMSKAVTAASNKFTAEEMDVFRAAVVAGTPLNEAMKSKVPTNGYLRTVVDALDAGQAFPDAFGAPAAKSGPSGVAKLPLVNINAGLVMDRVKQFREGAALPVVSPGAEIEDEEVANMMPNEVALLALEGRSMILGVTPVSLFAEFLAVIGAAREESDPVPLIMAGVFAVTEGYTVASAWADRYSQLPKPHPFTKFEVDGRRPVKSADGSSVANWVSSSKMNSSAVHILGHLIVNAAPEGTFLRTVKDQAGTIFSPPPAEDEKERSVIMRANAKSLTEADRNAAVQFAESFKKYVKVVALLFGKGDGSYDRLLDALKRAPAIMI